VRSPDGKRRRPERDGLRAWRPPAEAPGDAGDGDLVEAGGQPTLWPPRGARGTAVRLAALALAAGLLLGFAAGHLTAKPAMPARAAGAQARIAAAGPLDRTAEIFFTGNRCAIAHGRTLQLGIEIDNRSGSTITVSQISSALPEGGLRQIGSELATCGSLAVPGGLPLSTVASGASAWLTMTFAVKVRCPAPYPVLFVIKYAAAGKTTSMYFAGFPDLSQVPYTGCRAHS